MEHVYDRLYPHWCLSHQRLMTECEKVAKNCPTCSLYRSFLSEHGQEKAFEAWAVTRGWGK